MPEVGQVTPGHAVWPDRHDGHHPGEERQHEPHPPQPREEESEADSHSGKEHPSPDGHIDIFARAAVV